MVSQSSTIPGIWLCTWKSWLCSIVHPKAWVSRANIVMKVPDEVRRFGPGLSKVTLSWHYWKLKRLSLAQTLNSFLSNPSAMPALYRLQSRESPFWPSSWWSWYQFYRSTHVCWEGIWPPVVESFQLSWVQSPISNNWSRSHVSYLRHHEHPSA